MAERQEEALHRLRKGRGARRGHSLRIGREAGRRHMLRIGREAGQRPQLEEWLRKKVEERREGEGEIKTRRRNNT
jgi:hypothetical protein